MKLYEVINPSDAATFYAPDLKVAIAACLLLDGARGAYGAKACDGSEEGPLLMFGGEAQLRQLEMWPIEDWLEAHEKEIADALASMALGSPAYRPDYDTVLELMPKHLQPAYIKERTNRLGSSLNDFTTYAHKVAKLMRAPKPAKD